MHPDEDASGGKTTCFAQKRETLRVLRYTQAVENDGKTHRVGRLFLEYLAGVLIKLAVSNTPSC